MILKSDCAAATSYEGEKLTHKGLDYTPRDPDAMTCRAQGGLIVMWDLLELQRISELELLLGSSSQAKTYSLVRLHSVSRSKSRVCSYHALTLYLWSRLGLTHTSEF